MSQVLTAPPGGEVRAREDMIEIPDTALVRCPMVQYDLVPVARCVDCKAFGGLIDRFPGSRAPFVKRYILKCFYEPVQREMFNIAKG